MNCGFEVLNHERMHEASVAKQYNADVPKQKIQSISHYLGYLEAISFILEYKLSQSKKKDKTDLKFWHK